MMHWVRPQPDEAHLLPAASGAAAAVGGVVGQAPPLSTAAHPTPAASAASAWTGFLTAYAGLGEDRGHAAAHVVEVEPVALLPPPVRQDAAQPAAPPLAVPPLMASQSLPVASSLPPSRAVLQARPSEPSARGQAAGLRGAAVPQAVLPPHRRPTSAEAKGAVPSPRALELSRLTSHAVGDLTGSDEDDEVRRASACAWDLLERLPRALSCLRPSPQSLVDLVSLPCATSRRGKPPTSWASFAYPSSARQSLPHRSPPARLTSPCRPRLRRYPAGWMPARWLAPHRSPLPMSSTSGPSIRSGTMSVTKGPRRRRRRCEMGGIGPPLACPPHRATLILRDRFRSHLGLCGWPGGGAHGIPLAGHWIPPCI